MTQHDKESIKHIADYIWRKIQRGESGVSRSMIVEVIVEAMGDASARKDEGLADTRLHREAQPSLNSPTNQQPVGLTDVAKVIHTAIGFDERWDDLGDTTGINRSREAAREVMRAMKRESGAPKCPTCGASTWNSYKKGDAEGGIITEVKITDIKE